MIRYDHAFFSSLHGCCCTKIRDKQYYDNVTLGSHKKRRRRRKNVNDKTSTTERQEWSHKAAKITST